MCAGLLDILIGDQQAVLVKSKTKAEILDYCRLREDFYFSQERVGDTMKTKKHVMTVDSNFQPQLPRDVMLASLNTLFGIYSEISNEIRLHPIYSKVGQNTLSFISNMIDLLNVECKRLDAEAASLKT